MREQTIQRDVIKALRSLPDVLVYDTSHVGQVRLMSGRVTDLNQMRGQSDLLVLVAMDAGPVAYAIELKTNRGRQSPHQVKWQKNLWERRFNSGYHVCRSVDEVMVAIDKEEEWNERRKMYE
ncbi:MAG TPA: hypothetical protein EYN66_09035 [Myxococcales bacterium]|nr:hypothetical protein [Myxococcales bacterium]